MRGGRERERKRRTPTPSPFSSSQVDDDAPVGAIKAAYRALAKSCHPDVHADGHDLCILLNEAYETLADDRARAAYNATLQAALDAAADGYTGEPLSKWMAGKSRGRAVAGETRAVYVDELACIGCQNCIFEAAATFRVEKTHGRARVFAQWIDPEEKIQRSIDSCPVSCIHWVDKGDLPALEHVTQRVLTERRGVAAMMAGQGAAAADPFAATAKWVKDRAPPGGHGARARGAPPRGRRRARGRRVARAPGGAGGGGRCGAAGAVRRVCGFRVGARRRARRPGRRGLWAAEWWQCVLLLLRVLVRVRLGRRHGRRAAARGAAGARARQRGRRHRP
jgi:ferredoxin